ncbi:hypothetical protein [Metabacillus sp. 84]
MQLLYLKEYFIVYQGEIFNPTILILEGNSSGKEKSLKRGEGTIAKGK